MGIAMPYGAIGWGRAVGTPSQKGKMGPDWAHPTVRNYRVQRNYYLSNSKTLKSVLVTAISVKKQAENFLKSVTVIGSR